MEQRVPRAPQQDSGEGPSKDPTPIQRSKVSQPQQISCETTKYQHPFRQAPNTSAPGFYKKGVHGSQTKKESQNTKESKDSKWPTKQTNQGAQGLQNRSQKEQNSKGSTWESSIPWLPGESSTKGSPRESSTQDSPKELHSPISPKGCTSACGDNNNNRPNRSTKPGSNNLPGDPKPDVQKSGRVHSWTPGSPTQTTLGARRHHQRDERRNPKLNQPTQSSNSRGNPPIRLHHQVARQLHHGVNSSSNSTHGDAIKILQWNIDGLKTKHAILTSSVKTENFDVILLQETLQKEHHNISLSGYNCFKLPAYNQGTRGLITFIKKQLSS